MEGKWLTVSTLNGTVYLTVVPKDNHREHIFEKLSQALGCTVTAQDLKTRLGSTRPDFSKLPVDANWTHSKDICVLAYSRDCRVGIDLEFHSKNRLKLADRFYSGEEVERIHQVEQTEGENAAIRESIRLNRPKAKVPPSGFFTPSGVAKRPFSNASVATFSKEHYAGPFSRPA